MAGIALEVVSSQRPQMDESAKESEEAPGMEVKLLTPRASYEDTEVPKSKWEEMCDMHFETHPGTCLG